MVFPETDTFPRRLFPLLLRKGPCISAPMKIRPVPQKNKSEKPTVKPAPQVWPATADDTGSIHFYLVRLLGSWLLRLFFYYNNPRHFCKEILFFSHRAKRMFFTKKLSDQSVLQNCHHSRQHRQSGNTQHHGAGNPVLHLFQPLHITKQLGKLFHWINHPSLKNICSDCILS